MSETYVDQESFQEWEGYGVQTTPSLNEVRLNEERISRLKSDMDSFNQAQSEGWGGAIMKAPERMREELREWSPAQTVLTVNVATTIETIPAQNT